MENGLTERSYVDQLTFEFSEPVTSTEAVPMTLTDFGTAGNLDDAVALTASQFQWSSVPGTGNSVLTWSLESFAGGASSLPDGYYQLTLPSGTITDANGTPLDGTGNGQAGGDYVADFFVLQGDVNGDGVVDNNDMLAVDAVLGSRPGSSNWDPNADLTRAGTVTTSDRIIVYQNLGDSITLPTTEETSLVAALPASLPGWSFDGSTNLAATNSLPSGSPVNGITFDAGAGAFVVGGNAVELSGGITNQSPNTQTIKVPLTLTGGNQTIDTGSGNVTIAAGIGQNSGSVAITKNGPGTLVLSGANTYSGGTTVLEGVLQVDTAAGLLSGSSLTVGGVAGSATGSGPSVRAEPGGSSLATPSGQSSAPPAAVGQATSAAVSASVATAASAAPAAPPFTAAPLVVNAAHPLVVSGIPNSVQSLFSWNGMNRMRVPGAIDSRSMSLRMVQDPSAATLARLPSRLPRRAATPCRDRLPACPMACRETTSCQPLLAGKPMMPYCSWAIPCPRERWKRLPPPGDWRVRGGTGIRIRSRPRWMR